jgi:hypothetical protein
MNRWTFRLSAGVAAGCTGREDHFKCHLKRAGRPIAKWHGHSQLAVAMEVERE